MLKNTKRAIIATIVCALVLASAAGLPAEAKKSVSAGKVIKGKGLSTVYYLGEDGKRYVFPNGNTYFSWFDDFEDVEEIEMDELTEYPLGGNVNYKPGAYLVKITTIPKVYAVSPGGTLRWVKTEELARKLYGERWNLMVDDVPDSFFVNYAIGEPIDEEDDYSPDEEAEVAPEISHDLGLRARVKVQKKARTLLQKRCTWLNSAITKLQKRLNRWGMEVPELGNDYLDQCVVDDSTEPGSSDNGRKVELCHIPPGEPEAAVTIIVNKAAARAHLAHGDSLGACDSDGNADEDNTAPVISDINVDTSETSATITWTTDEDSTSVVMYADMTLSDASTTVMEETGDSGTMSHSVELTGLSASTTYYFQVKSVDSESNEAVSSEDTFVTTTEEPEDTTAPEISAVTVTPATDSAVVTWTTDELADSLVEYADASLSDASTTVMSASDSVDVTSHSLTITGLSATTTYYFIVKSMDTSDNIAETVEDTFETLE